MSYPYSIPRPAFAPRVMRGISLIELMIAMAVGLVVVGAVSLVYINASSARAQIEKTGRLTENGRFALFTLAEDLRLAGFYGEATIGTTAPAAPTTPADYICATDVGVLTNLMPIHVYGIHNVTGGTKPSCIPEAVVAGTDIVVVRRVSTSTVSTGSAPMNRYYLQNSLCGTELTSTTLAYAGTGTNMGTAFPRLKKDCASLADLRTLVAHVYYVAANNNPGDGIPTLKRVEMTTNDWGAAAVFPIADGVEQFQLVYGVDDGSATGSTAGDGVPDAFTSAPASMDAWRNTMTAKMNLLVRSPDKTPGYSDANQTYTVGPTSVVGAGDGYKRHVFTSVVSMENVVGRRQQ